MRRSVVAISYSSATAINRKVYGLLGINNDLKLIIPKEIFISDKVIEAEPFSSGDPFFINLPLKGKNPRVHYFKGIWKVLVTNRPEFIYIENDPISFLCLICCVYKFFYGGKIFCQTNENFSLSLKRFFSIRSNRQRITLLVKRLLNLVIRPFVNVVFTINYEGKKVFEELNYKKARWIPLGYDTSFFYEDPVIRNKLRNENAITSFTIGYFGRIVPEKGLMIMLKVLSELTAYPWKLMIDDFALYQTPYINEIKEYLKQDPFNERIVFFHAHHEEIAGYMNACDLVIVPSITTEIFKEQYGRVVQEAIACGCLTIVSNSGFLPHFFNDSTCIFKEGDMTDIKNKIEYFITLGTQDKEMIKEKVMNYISSNFTINRQSEIIGEEMNKFAIKKQAAI